MSACRNLGRDCFLLHAHSGEGLLGFAAVLFDEAMPLHLAAGEWELNAPSLLVCWT